MSPRSAFADTYFASKGFATGTANAPITVSVPQDRARPGAVIERCYKNAPVLSIKHNTYFPIYERLFEPFVGQPVTVVEIGVLNGGSLFMWRDYFGPSARIIGVDLNPEARWLENEGFEIHIGSQADPEFWEAFFAKVGPVDIIIDDGGHTFAQQIVTTASVLQHVRNGGMLIVEDTHSSYMPEFGGPSPVSFIAYAKNIVDGINYRFSRFADDRPSERVVWSLQFFESVDMQTASAFPIKNSQRCSSMRNNGLIPAWRCCRTLTFEDVDCHCELTTRGCGRKVGLSRR
jgi:hypothetical protein